MFFLSYFIFDLSDYYYYHIIFVTYVLPLSSESILHAYLIIIVGRNSERKRFILVAVILR